MSAGEEMGRSVPATIAWNTVLADTDDVVLFAPRLRVYRSSFHVIIAGRLRPTASAAAKERFAKAEVRGRSWDLTTADLARGLRLGVQFGDGRRTVLNRHPFIHHGPLESAPLMSNGRGTSDDGAFDWEINVAAIPQTGSVEFYYQWLDLGIAESMAEIDGDALRAAAGRSVELWPGGGNDA